MPNLQRFDLNLSIEDGCHTGIQLVLGLDHQTGVSVQTLDFIMGKDRV